MSGISNADTFSVIDPSAQTKADHGKAAWTFLNVPPEIRRKIYQEMLVTPYKHPGPPPQLKNIYPDEAKSLEHFHIKPAFSLFFVSKQISFEAREIFYGQNTFTTFFRPTRKVYDMIETVAGYDSTKNVWVHKRNELIHAVSTIYDENYANVPEWLFGDFSPKYENGEEQLEYWMDLGEVIYKPEGLYLPAFLRKIGPTHASMITTIEIILGSLQLSTDIFPVFVETLRKHVKGLSKVVLEFNGINNYGTKLTFAKRNAEQQKQVIRFFHWLRILFHHSPKLTDLEMRNCSDEFKTMGRLIASEKRTGQTTDIKREWITMFDAAKQRFLANPSPVHQNDIYLPNWPLP